MKYFKKLINSTAFRRRRNQKQDNNPTNHFVVIKKVCKSGNCMGSGSSSGSDSDSDDKPDHRSSHHSSHKSSRKGGCKGMYRFISQFEKKLLIFQVFKTCFREQRLRMLTMFSNTMRKIINDRKLLL